MEHLPGILLGLSGLFAGFAVIVLFFNIFGLPFGRPLSGNTPAETFREYVFFLGLMLYFVLIFFARETFDTCGESVKCELFWAGLPLLYFVLIVVVAFPKWIACYFKEERPLTDLYKIKGLQRLLIRAISRKQKDVRYAALFDKSLFKKLKRTGVDVNAHGYTALMSAASEGHTETVIALIAAGADANERNFALMSAASEGHAETVTILLETGIDVNAPTIYGYTALMIAAREGHTEIVTSLLEAGADVNAQAENGFTPLMSAASEGHTETVIILIEGGAAINIRDSYGKTALKYAMRYGFKETARMLKAAGGK